MENLPEGTFDNIGDNEYLRRYFFARHYDNEKKQWSYNTFALRDLDPPENYISFVRELIDGDPVAYAEKIYHKSKLKSLRGYVLLKAGEIRTIDIESLKIDVFTIGSENNAHAGLFTWCNDVLLQGSVESPEILRLKKRLFEISQNTYVEFSDDIPTEV